MTLSSLFLANLLNVLSVTRSILFSLLVHIERLVK